MLHLQADHVMQVKHGLPVEGGNHIVFLWLSKHNLFTFTAPETGDTEKISDQFVPIMTSLLVMGDKLLDMWTKGEREKQFCVDEEKESRQHKHISHSIEEILRRPIRKEGRVYRSCSVIKENTEVHNQLSYTGKVLNLPFINSLIKNVTRK